MQESDAMTSVALSNTIKTASVIVSDRMRHDLGDVLELANSIKRHGIIQPIIIARNWRLIAGGRRLAAMKLLKREFLEHSKDFIYNDETDPIQLQAMELEENLKRKNLTWSEEVLGKQQLFSIMQSIHGASKGFGAGRSASNDGFSLRSLAAMLGENVSTTSRDIELAGFVVRHPSLAALPTRADAQRKLGVAVTVAAMQSLAKRSVVPQSVNPLLPTGSQIVGGDTTVVAGGDRTANPNGSISPLVALQDERWTLYEGRFQENIIHIPTNSVDLICTDLPYNIGLGTSSAAHSAGLGSFVDDSIDIATLCADVAVESYRVLRDNRFAVFFYGMNYHGVLYDALTTVGFTVDVYPFIWLRDRSAPPDGFARYSKSYDPAFIASKGTPRFIRPNQSNSLSVPSVRGAERLHAAQKPVTIMQKFIEDMTTSGCVVLDMFAGAGTTGEAALRSGRKAILFELEPANCILIRSRLGVL